MLSTVVAGLPPIAQIAPGGSTVCFVTRSGWVLCGAEAGDRFVPIPNLSGATQVAVGTHSCARLADGSARCWGNNREGELGDGTTIERPEAVAVSGLARVAQVVVGDFHSCARLADSSVRCWGMMRGSRPRTLAAPVAGLAGAGDLAAARQSTCARRADGSVVCWGEDFGATPVRIRSLSSATQIAAGGSGSYCARRADGSAHCWGRVYLGHNNYAFTAEGASVAREIAPANAVDQIAVSGTEWLWNCARLGRAVTCGRYFGGDGNPEDRAAVNGLWPAAGGRP